MTSTQSDIDLSRVDLLALCSQDTRLKKAASTDGGEYSGPCPFCGGTDRFNVWPDHTAGKGRWWCRKCELHGDAIDYVRQRDSLSFQAACEYLRLNSANQTIPTAEEPKMKQRRDATTDEFTYRKLNPPTWDDAAALEVLEHCRCALWSDEGARALKWLDDRGLRAETVRRFQLGYNADDQELFGLWVPAGIVIPCFVQEKLWYLKVRRRVQSQCRNKYGQVKGGAGSALFGARLMEGKPAVVICEGEFDAMLLHQEAGDLVDVVANGSAQGKPALLALADLIQAGRWLAAFDRDDAGERGAEWWLEFSHRTVRIMPPHGNDLTDFHADGGDLGSWISEQVDQLGIASFPARTSEGSSGIPARADEQAESQEQRVERLPDIGDQSPEQARQSAEPAEEAGPSCSTMTSIDGERDPAPTGDSAEALCGDQLLESDNHGQASDQDDGLPTKPCRPLGIGDHRCFWKGPGGWTCQICHPPSKPDVETYVLPA